MSRLRPLSVLPLLLAACAAGSPSSNCDTDACASTVRTIESCDTDIPTSASADAAADEARQLDFFRKYFRCVSVAVTSDHNFTVTSSGLSPHKSWYYAPGDPNYEPFPAAADAATCAANPCPGLQRGAASCRADGVCRFQNPNRIGEKSLAFTIPRSPVRRSGVPDQVPTSMVDRTMNTNGFEYRGGPVGVALDSVAIFNDAAAPGDDIDQERYGFDAYDGHPTPDATYHYHSTTPGPLEVLAAAGLVTNATPGTAEVELYGIMCDGTLVLGCTELDGSAVAPGPALDAQNGHVGDISDGSTTYFPARYHTHVCPGVLTAHKYTPEIQYYEGLATNCPK